MASMVFNNGKSVWCEYIYIHIRIIVNIIEYYKYIMTYPLECKKNNHVFRGISV